MSKRLACVALALLAAVILLMPDVRSQQRRRTSRRTTSPTRPQSVPRPSLPDEPRVVSTADEPQEAQPRRTNTRARQGAQAAENEQLRGTVRELSTQVEQLSGQLNQMKADQRAMYDLERLTRAEQRAEGLQAQLRDVLEKQANTQAQVERVDEQLRPENIDRTLALVGTFRPDEARDNLRRQLENEKRRLQALMDVLDKNRQRLEASLAHADDAVARLRTEYEEARRKEGEEGTDAERTERAPRPAAGRTTAAPAETSPPPPEQ